MHPPDGDSTRNTEASVSDSSSLPLLSTITLPSIPVIAGAHHHRLRFKLLRQTPTGNSNRSVARERHCSSWAAAALPAQTNTDAALYRLRAEHLSRLKREAHEVAVTHTDPVRLGLNEPSQNRTSELCSTYRKQKRQGRKKGKRLKESGFDIWHFMTEQCITTGHEHINMI